MPLPAALKKDVSELTPEKFVSRWMFEATPHVFSGSQNLYIDWKHQLGSMISVDPRAITLIGTAAIGTSFNPNKNFKSFDAASDIDVAIVSAHHFDLMWRWLRTLGSSYYALSAQARAAVDDHRKNFIFKGVIATDRILQYSPLAAVWMQALNSMSAVDPTKGREINARLYADYDALRAYHVDNVRVMAKKIIEST